MSDLIELDHLGFAVGDLAPLLETFTRLGFSPTEPRELERLREDGSTESLGQISAHLVFGDTYVELTAVPDRRSGNHLEEFLARHEGLHILALRSADIDAARSRCAAAGLHPTPVQLASRRIEYGERRGDARFRWWMLPAEDLPDGLLCHVENLRPGLVYQPAVQSHPNGALAVSGVTVNTTDPETAARRWGSVLGLSESPQQCFELGNARVDLRDLGNLQPLLPAGLAGLHVRVPELRRIRAYLPGSRCEVLAETSATLTLRLPPPANALLVFGTE